MSDMAELVLRIRADASQLEREMKKAQGIITQNSKGMTSALAGVTAQAKALLPAISAVAVVSFARNTIVAADALNDLSMRTGVAGSTLSALNIPLLQAGSNVEEFASGINRMNNMVGEAAKGSQEAIKAFDDLGLSVAKLQQLSPEQQFYEIASALSNIESQSQMTNAGMAIFGRGFASLIPLIKEAGGNMDEFVAKLKDSGSALSEDQLARIDEWGDRWTSAIEHAKLGIVDFLDYFYKLGEAHRQMIDDMGLPANATTRRPNVPSDEELAKSVRKQLGMSEPSARGSNAGILKSKESEAIDKAQKSLEEYNRELQRQHEYARLSPADAAARKAYYDTLDMAQKAGIANAEELAQANAEVARSNEEMQKAMQESARFSAELKDQFASTAKSIMFDSKNAGDALKRLAESLAEMIAQKYILGTMSDSLFGSPGGSGGGLLGSILPGIFGSPTQQAIGASIAANSGVGGFFADGGTPPIGVPSVVGERGPELFVPKVAGTIIPNHAMGGNNVTVIQNFNVSNDVPALIDMKIRQATQPMVAAAHESVFSAIQKGGREARMVGRRN